MCFPVNFAKFLSTPFYRTHPGDWFCILLLSSPLVYLMIRNISTIETIVTAMEICFDPLFPLVF